MSHVTWRHGDVPVCWFTLEVICYYGVWINLDCYTLKQLSGRSWAPCLGTKTWLQTYNFKLLIIVSYHRPTVDIFSTDFVMHPYVGDTRDKWYRYLIFATPLPTPPPPSWYPGSATELHQKILLSPYPNSTWTIKVSWVSIIFIREYFCLDTLGIKGESSHDKLQQCQTTDNLWKQFPVLYFQTLNTSRPIFLTKTLQTKCNNRNEKQSIMNIKEWIAYLELA